MSVPFLQIKIMWDHLLYLSLEVGTGTLLPVVWENRALRKWDTIYFMSLLWQDSRICELFSYRDPCYLDSWIESLPSHNLLANIIYSSPSRWLCVSKYSRGKLDTEMRVISAILQVPYFLPETVSVASVLQWCLISLFPFRRIRAVLLRQRLYCQRGTHGRSNSVKWVRLSA